MKQVTKTKIANGVVYTVSSLALLAGVAIVVGLMLVAWQVVAIFAGVFGFAFLMSWATKNTDIEELGPYAGGR